MPSITFCAFENQSVDFKSFFHVAYFQNFNDSTMNLTGEEFFYQLDQFEQKCFKINHYNNNSSQELLTAKYLVSDYFRFEVNLSTQFNNVDVYLSDNYLNTLDWTQLVTTFGNANKGWIDIKTTKVVEHQVGRPHNKCKDMFDITYRKLNCLDQCKNRNYVSKYNCTLRNYYSLLDYQFCNFSLDEFDLVCDQECPKECSSTKFDQRVYTSQRNDSLTIDVYYSDLTYIERKETPKMTELSLLNEIGGALSLFVGVTFLGLLEFVEFFFEIVFVFYKIKN
jgi:hypothetical protein